jgi:hypothetical protein
MEEQMPALDDAAFGAPTAARVAMIKVACDAWIDWLEWQGHERLGGRLLASMHRALEGWRQDEWDWPPSEAREYAWCGRVERLPYAQRASEDVLRRLAAAQVAGLAPEALGFSGWAWGGALLDAADEAFWVLKTEGQPQGELLAVLDEAWALLGPEVAGERERDDYHRPEEYELRGRYHIRFRDLRARDTAAIEAAVGPVLAKRGAGQTSA